MITREILSDLMGFDPDSYLTTTLYLQIDSSLNSGHLIELKDLVRGRKTDLKNQKLAAEVEKSISSDLRKIQDFVTLKFSRGGVRTLAIFSCSGKKWFNVLPLNIPLRSRLIVSSRPHYSPISLVLEERRRFLTILIDREKARLFEVFAGEILEHSSILDEVPNKPRMGGFGGYQERRIERHVEDHVRRHFRNVSDAAYLIFKREACDSLLLGGTEHNTHEFHNFLQNTLHDKMAGAFHEEMFATSAAVLEKTVSMEKQIRLKEEHHLLERFFGQVNSGGLGLVGLDSTLRALQNGQVNTLLIQDGLSKKGYRCDNCGMLQTGNGNCETCSSPSHGVENILEEMIEESLHQGCQVKRISQPENKLALVGGVGAMLRFKT